MNIVAVALGGACGAVARWSLSRAISSRIPSTYPLGTLAANLIGCFLFGVVFAWLSKRADLRPDVSLFLLTGFMGSFTTFSTYTFESLNLWRTNGAWWSLGNILLHNGLGIALLMAGLWVAGRLGAYS